jgi:hypothetical protein
MMMMVMVLLMIVMMYPTNTIKPYPGGGSHIHTYTLTRRRRVRAVTGVTTARKTVTGSRPAPRRRRGGVGVRNGSWQNLTSMRTMRRKGGRWYFHSALAPAPQSHNTITIRLPHCHQCDQDVTMPTSCHHHMITTFLSDKHHTIRTQESWRMTYTQLHIPAYIHPNTYTYTYTHTRMRAHTHSHTLSHTLTPSGHTSLGE